MEISSEHRSATRSRKLGREQKDGSAKRRREPDFLTAEFSPIPAYEVPTVVSRLGKVDLIELEEQARHLLDVYGIDYRLEHSGNDYRDLMSLHDEVKKSLGEKVMVELSETDDGTEKRQEFFTYSEIDGFPTDQVFFLPVRIVETIDGDLKDILISFFALLEKKSPFLIPKCSYDMQYCLGIIDMDDEKIDPEQSEWWSEDYRCMAERYVNGDINKVFEEIWRIARQYTDDGHILSEILRKKIDGIRNPEKRRYKTPNGKEFKVSELLDCIREGLDICLEDNLFNYELRFIRYNIGDEKFYDGEIGSDEIVDFDRFFMFSWGCIDDDKITESVLEEINNDLGNFGATVMLDVHRVSAIDGKVEPVDYPKRWYEWFIRYLNFVYE